MSFQLFNFKSHFKHVMKFLMFDSWQNSATTKFSKIKLTWNHFLYVIKRSSYVKIITICCYDDMLRWNLRRIDDLIDKINNIVDVEQDKIDDKNVEFEEFEILLCIKNLRRAKFSIDWTTNLTQNFKWICNCFESNRNKIVNCMM